MGLKPRRRSEGRWLLALLRVLPAVLLTVLIAVIFDPGISIFVGAIASVMLTNPYAHWTGLVEHLRTEAETDRRRPSRQLAAIVRWHLRPRRTIVGEPDPLLLVWWFHRLRLRRIERLFDKRTHRMVRVIFPSRSLGAARRFNHRLGRERRPWLPWSAARICWRGLVEARLARALCRLGHLTARYDPFVAHPFAAPTQLATHWWGASSRQVRGVAGSIERLERRFARRRRMAVAVLRWIDRLVNRRSDAEHHGSIQRGR